MQRGGAGRVHRQGGQHGQRAGKEHEYHPGGTDGGELGEPLEPEHRERHDDGTHHDDHEHKTDVGGQHARLWRYSEGNAHGGGRHGNHAASENAEEEGVENVVDGRGDRSGDAAQVPVEGQPRLGRDGGAHEGPCEHGQRIAEGKTEKYVPYAGAPFYEEHADDELGAGDMLAAEEPREVFAGLQLVVRDRLAFKLIQFVQRFHDGALLHCFHGASFPTLACMSDPIAHAVLTGRVALD